LLSSVFVPSVTSLFMFGLFFLEGSFPHLPVVTMVDVMCQLPLQNRRHITLSVH
jgi:hypothetical protein